MLLEVAATRAVNQVTLLAIVPLQALLHPCGVAVVAAAVDTEASEVGLLAPIVQQLATNVVDQTITLVTVKLRL